ncbi:MAG: response regulator transcription factor [Dehalococcoidia bacterium]|nr:response regulator transcription factor [Dehalococcoidia bacterium]
MVNIVIINDSELPPELKALTERELQILTLIAAGYTNKEIGSRLNLARATVRNNITRIRAKLNMDARGKLIKFALDNGLRLDSGDSAAN